MYNIYICIIYICEVKIYYTIILEKQVDVFWGTPAKWEKMMLSAVTSHHGDIINKMESNHENIINRKWIGISTCLMWIYPQLDG